MRPNKINLDDIKNLLEQKQKQNKKGNFFQRFLTKILPAFQISVSLIDKFINFVSKDIDTNSQNISVHDSARSPILFGLIVIIVFVVFGGGWAAIAPLNSATIAPGILISDTNRKIIQSEIGGTVKEIFVRQGDKVEVGQKLIDFDDTKAKLEYEDVLNRYRHALANESRLIAERDGLDEIIYPEFLVDNKDIEEVEKMIQLQEKIFISRKSLMQLEIDGAHYRISQQRKQIESLQLKKKAFEKGLSVMEKSIEGIKTLMESQHAAESKLLDQEAKREVQKSDISSIEGDIVRTLQEINKIEIEIVNMKNKYLNNTLSELKENQVNVSSLKEKLLNMTDVLNKTSIASPVNGNVIVLYHFTKGGVIRAGEPIMEISPTDDSLVIEAKVSPKNIDTVKVGMITKIRFSAFKSRRTPLFTGKVVSISPDIVYDRNQPGRGAEMGYYATRIEIDMEEFNKIASVKKLTLYPGMMAEVQIINGTKTLFRYLLDPITDVMFKAFREQ